MIFYERNTKLLSEYQPELFTAMQNHKSELEFPNLNVGFGKNDKGEIDNVVINSNGNLFVVGKKEEAKTWSDGVDTQAKTIIIFGLGMGWHIEYLAEKYPDISIHVIEPDKRVLAHVMHIRDMENVFKKCKIYVDTPVSSVKGAMFNMLTHPLARGIALVPFYVAVYTEYCKNLYDESRKMLNDWAVMINTKRSLSDKWYKNRIVNAKIPSVNAKSLMGKFKNIPGIIVGAAPSLQGQIEELRALQGKAVIIAASTAAEILKSHGIKPTFMFAIDQDPITSGQLHENMDGDVPLIFDGQVAQNSLKYKGRKFQILLNVNRYTGMAIKDLPVLESGPSVANVTMDLLYKLGCNPIMICGMDMSYTNNKLYCDGTKFNKDIAVDDGKLMKMQGMNGEICYTEPSFLSMRNWYEEYVKRIKPPAFNCTAQGIPIEGIAQQKFSDFQFEDANIDEIVDEAYFHPDSTEPNYIDINAINGVNNEIIKELDTIKAQIQASNNITPQMSQTKAWLLLDEFISSMAYIHEIRMEYQIINGKPKEEALKEYTDKRTKTIIENIDKLKKMLE
jgi:hypothetical protein